jgi:hypothetical protein
MAKTFETTVAVIGIDIGKNSFHIIGLDRRGAIVLRQRWSRGHVEARLANMPPCLIGMEACVGAHHLSRRLKALGHDARLMPAKYVRPYSKGQKNDFRDAEAIAEAVQRPTMKFVATKTVEQLDLQALHRVRERLVSQRTGIINQIRAFLLERAIAVRQGRLCLRMALPQILAAPPDVLSSRMLHIIEDLAGDWRQLDERIHLAALTIGYGCMRCLQRDCMGSSARSTTDHRSKTGLGLRPKTGKSDCSVWSDRHGQAQGRGQHRVEEAAHALRRQDQARRSLPSRRRARNRGHVQAHRRDNYHVACSRSSLDRSTTHPAFGKRTASWSPGALSRGAYRQTTVA